MAREYNLVANIVARTQDFVDGVNDARQVAERQAKNIDSAFSGLQGTFKKVAGFIGAAFAVDKIKDFGLNMLDTTANIQAMESQYEQVMGGMKASTDKYLDEMSKKWNKHPNELKSAMLQYYAILKGKGLSEQDAYATAKAYLERTVDANAFANESMSDTTGRFMGMIKGEYDSVDTAMVNMNVTMLDTKAQEKYGKKFAELTVTQQEMLKTQEALRQHTAAGVLGQGAREADAYQNNLTMVKNKWNELLSQFGSPLLELANKGLKLLSDNVGSISFDSVMKKLEPIKQWLLSMLPSVDNLKTVFQNLMPIVTTVGGALAVSFQHFISFLPTILNNVTGILAKFSEWSGFLPVISGLVAAFLTYQGALKVITIYETTYQAIQKTSILLYNAQRAAAIAYALYGGGLTGVLQGMRAAVISLNLSFLANPIVLVIAAIVGLGVALVVAYKKSETFRNIVNGVWASLKEGFSAVINWFTTTLPQWISEVGKWFTNLYNQVIEIFTNLWNGIKSGASVFFSYIMAALQPFITFFVNSWNNLKLLVLSIVEGFFALLTGDFSGVKLALIGIITAFKDQFLNYWNLIKSTVLVVASALWEGIKSGFSAGKDFVINTAVALYNGVINWFKSLYTSGIQLVGNITNGIVSGFRNAKDSAIDLFKNLYNGVVSWISAVPSKVSDMKDGIINTLRGIDLKQIGINVIQGFINGISSMITKVWSTINDIATGLKKKLTTALDIHSPSRVMFEIGGYVSEGLALGMEKTKSLVEDAALGLAHASNFANDFSSVNTALPVYKSQSKALASSVTKPAVVTSTDTPQVSIHIENMTVQGGEKGANDFLKFVKNKTAEKGWNTRV